MNDVFARVALALRHLLDASTVHGPAKEECLRVIGELQVLDSGITEVVAEQVQKQADIIAGKVNEISEEHAEIKARVFSGELEAAIEQVRRGNEAGLAETATETTAAAVEPPVEGEKGSDTTAAADFNGADPQKFDHDDDGAAGGSLPAAETQDPLEMTVAQAEAWLDEHEVDRKGITKRDDLRALVALEMEARLPEGADTTT